MTAVIPDVLATYSKKSPDVQAVQWLPDSSNTLAIIENFFGNILSFNVKGTIYQIVFQNSDGANLNTYPGWWFLLDADGHVDALTDDQFRKLYNVK